MASAARVDDDGRRFHRKQRPESVAASRLDWYWDELRTARSGRLLRVSRRPPWVTRALPPERCRRRRRSTGTLRPPNQAAAGICLLRALTAGNFTPFVLLWIERMRASTSSRPSAWIRKHKIR